MTDISTKPKLSVNRAALMTIQEACNGVINQRSPKPILSCVKLVAEDGKLVVYASDMEMSVRYETTLCDIQSSGEICLPAEKFRDAVKQMSGDTVMIEVVGEQAVISDKEGEHKLYTQNPADFPLMEFSVDNVDIELTGVQLLKLIGQVSFAMSEEDGRTVKGLLLDFGGARLSMVSTDGRRMALTRVESTTEGKRGTIPGKAVKRITSMISNADESVSINLETNRVTVSGADWTITSNLLEGEFPAYDSVIPTEFANRAVFGTAGLVAAIGRAAVSCGEESDAVKFAFNPITGLSLNASTVAQSESSVRFGCKYAGDEMTIALNNKFAIEGAKASGAEEIIWHMNGPKSPVVYRATGDEHWLYMIVPIVK